VGVITTKILDDLKDKDDLLPEVTLTKEVMSRSVVMVTSDTSIEEAASVIDRQNVNCLLVMENKHLVGIFNKKLIP
jgi:CBS domain-containing protein